MIGMDAATANAVESVCVAFVAAVFVAAYAWTVVKGKARWPWGNDDEDGAG